MNKKIMDWLLGTGFPIFTFATLAIGIAIVFGIYITILVREIIR